ncbi:DUF86 domain-containing protein [Mesotoga sp. B105.6.4]|jgi:uncharacterized protein with HEPN domain|uniref:HepT-like ribonuclease domain-containing protein n=1 Tax=Mesotoga sp. B105.6.4 TaxID=1582224 RepID=UPI000CC0281E|nr:DUF86 domain-containing protein [Mesotoga sp. B105.6.4]PNQ05803.1 hypothetical protein RM69_02895 [Mesotoga sp. SC_NapDC3]PNS41637.1 hypothetical protein RJ60_04145 [Mesotoga sp. B105.6.4]PXF33412.1 hypothetical protein EU77_13855 [Mesotoga sp. SC_NapDC]RIZ61254.1 hypothetical protein KU43_03775 [Mesotoga sp. SC_NapDC2]
MRPDDAEKHIEEILRLIGEIEVFLQGVSFDEFEHNRSINYSVLYALLLIGETVKRIPPSFRTAHSNIPWKEIAGTRDVLIHDYLETDLEIVWKTVQDSLPVLKNDLLRILNEGLDFPHES